MITMVLPLLPMCHAMARTSAAETQNNAQQTGSARKTTLWSGLPATIWHGMIALHCVSIVGNTVPQGNLIFTIPKATGTSFLPRVVQCSDGSYCCDNEPACCLNHTGVVLNGNGVVVTTLPSLTSTSSSSSTSATYFYDQLNTHLCSEFCKSLLRDIVYILSASRSYCECYINRVTNANPISRHCWRCGGGCCCYRLCRWISHMEAAAKGNQTRSRGRSGTVSRRIQDAIVCGHSGWSLCKGTCTDHPSRDGYRNTRTYGN